MKFKLFGTEIYISFLFAALLTLMLATDRTGLIIPTLLAVVLHESGHLFTMWLMECSPKSIKLIPSSVQIVRDFSVKSYGETLIALCGPAANLAVFLSMYLVYLSSENQKILTFALLNLIIALFNLLPVKGLDGGTILFNVLSSHFGIIKAELILKTITGSIGIALFTFGIYATCFNNFNPSIFIIAIYLIISVIIKI